MKKFVVVLLLILPFALIYFISFTGRVLSIYTHINVENILVVDNNYNINNNEWITLSKGESKQFSIKLLPELSSNKEYIVSNSDKQICDFDDGKLTAIDYGVSTIIITSKDRHFVQFVFNVRVVEKDIKNIITNKDKVEVNVGKFELIDITIEPSTVIEENRYLEYISLDESIATISNNVITGVSVGQTKVIIRSKHKPEIYKEIDVIVLDGLGKGVFFDYADTSKVYEVNTNIFDLKTITRINLDGVGYEDLTYSLDMLTTAVDISNLNDGIVVFTQEKVPVVISVSVELSGSIYTDSITIRYLSN